MLNITAGGLSSGYKKYLENIIPRLDSHPKVSELLVGLPETMDISSWIVKFPFAEWISLKTQIFPWQSIGNEAKRKVIQFNPDVLFIPTGRFLKMGEVPVVVMIHNMEPLVFANQGNPLLEKIRNCFRAKLARIAVNNANRIIAVSGYVKQFLEKYWNIPSSQISVIYHGINKPRNKSTTKPDVIPETLQSKFLFTAGSVRPSRGLEDIILALKFLVPESWHQIDGIVIAGSIHATMNRYRQRLEAKIRRNNISGCIFFAGNLNEQEMKWCYQNCLAFIMSSRVEACPNIALEAISHGCPCISADNQPLPEIFGEAALYYPSKNGKHLAEAIQTVLSWDNHERHESSKRARKRATKFSWDITAKKTVDELQKAIEG